MTIMWRGEEIDSFSSQITQRDKLIGPMQLSITRGLIVSDSSGTLFPEEQVNNKNNNKTEVVSKGKNTNYIVLFEELP